MLNTIFHIRIKNQYAAAIIEDLIKAQAIEVIEQEQSPELTDKQKLALDKELETINTNPEYLLKWTDSKNTLLNRS